MKSRALLTAIGLLLAASSSAYAAILEHPESDDLLAQIRNQFIPCKVDHQECEADILAAIQAQALATADREISQALLTLMHASLSDAIIGAQPLPTEVSTHFSAIYPAEKVSQIGWVLRDEEYFDRRSHSSDARFIQEDLTFQKFTIAWDLSVDLATIPSALPPPQTWIEKLFSLKPKRNTVSIHYTAGVRAPEEWTEYQASHSRYQALIAISPTLLKQSRNKQLMTFAHEAQHALDYLSGTPENFKEQRAQPVELVTAAPNDTWQGIEEISAISNCRQIRESLGTLKHRYFNGLKLIGPLYFSSTEHRAFLAEAHFARAVLALDRATYIALRMPQDAISLRDLKQLLQALVCGIVDSQAQALYPVPDFLPDYFGELFNTSP